MSTCPFCNYPAAPGTRFCTECGKPLVAGPAPVPPTMPGVQPPMPPGYRPPAPPMPPQQGMPPRPVFSAPAPQVAAAAPPTAAGLQLPRGESIRCVSQGSLYNDGKNVTVLTMDNHVAILLESGEAKLEEIADLRYALVGDYDGDGTHDLAVITGTQVWIQRYSAMGMVAGGKVALAAIPENLTTAPFTHDGRSVLMTVTKEKVSFCVLHPAKGLVEIGSAPVPAVES